ncbi:serine hydrolase [Phytohabitans sp. LJ34]|uniref:serine hydrolase n=1 Tax=Phytohabitans sp. LJ34 TaxID=3452217 RepID=UPI003F8C2C83
MIYLSQAWRRARRLRRRGRLAVAGLALAGLAATLVAGGPVASAHPGQPSAVFDPNEVDWVERRERTEEEFARDIDEWKQIGALPVDIEADGFGGEPWFASVVQDNLDGRDWRVEPRMTKAEYEAAAAKAKADGLRLVDREIYSVDGAGYFAAAWVQNVEGLTSFSWFGLTLAQLAAREQEQRRAERMPIDFDMYRDLGGIRYSVVFLDNPEGLDWHLHGDFDNAQYAAAFGEYDADGFRMLSFDSALSGAKQLFGGIWVENANDRRWRGWREMTAHQFGNNWHLNVDQGYRQIFVGRYQTSTGVKYASIWRQNSDKPDWRLRPDVDALIAGEMGEDDVPGIAVAVIENGVFRYTRGFGKADIAGDILMDADHVLRWASVSKAVGGALTLRLDEKPDGDVDRHKTANSYYEPLDDKHQATLEQLAGNRGCVRHYAGHPKSSLEATDPEQFEVEKAADDNMAQSWYSDAQAVVGEFDADPLRSWTEGGGVSTACTPGDSYLYSTHGYTILGAALEEATGAGVKDLVRQEISEPLGLTTLRQEEPYGIGEPVRRAKLYEGADNDEVAPDDTTWKTLGGGLESSVRDMARFGAAMIAGQVVADDDYIWDGGDEGWSYAYGWALDTEGGHKVADKDGKQLGSDAHLRVYPDDGIAIAVIVNREEFDGGAGDHATYIAEEIGDLMV